MALSFSFSPTPNIIFGNDKIKELPRLIALFGNKTLLVTGEKSFLHTPNWNRLIDMLNEVNIQYINEIVNKEPSPELIDKICEKYRGSGIDSVVAIGGGSVLDAGKAISAMLTADEPVMKFMEGVGTGESHSGTKIPFIAVPTTSGTGSETTKNAVLSKTGKDGFKKSLRHDNFAPNFAIVDPMLTLTCSASLTAACSMDAFSQLIESYISTKASPLTDALCLSGIESIVQSLPIAYNAAKGDAIDFVESLEARASLSYASMISGITLSNAGLGVVHGFASAIGGMFDIPHGVVCATLMAASNRATLDWLKNNDIQNIAVQKLARIGTIFATALELNVYGQATINLADFAVQELEEWTTKFNIPTLSEFGILEDDFETIVNRTELKNNPAPLDKEELINILNCRLHA